MASTSRRSGSSGRRWSATGTFRAPPWDRLFSSALVGVLFGSLYYSACWPTVSDAAPVLIGVTLYFSALTFMTARADTVDHLLIIRFLGGVGLGGIMPNAVSLVGEY